jgi:hypothetical protein
MRLHSQFEALCTCGATITTRTLAGGIVCERCGREYQASWPAEYRREEEDDAEK